MRLQQYSRDLRAAITHNRDSTLSDDLLWRRRPSTNLVVGVTYRMNVEITTGASLGDAEPDGSVQSRRRHPTR